VTVTCWNLEERRIVWRYQGNWKCKFRVSCFAADVTDNGRSVVIVIGLHLQRDEVPKESVIFLFPLNPSETTPMTALLTLFAWIC
jgi:hypothetical protein